MILGIFIAGLTLFLILVLEFFHCCFGGLYGEIFLCRRPGICRFWTAHFVWFLLFLLAMFLVFTCFQTSMNIMNNPRWTSFPTQCNEIQSKSCSRVFGDLNIPLSTCDTCVYQSNASSIFAVDFLKSKVQASQLLSQAKKCISYLSY